MARFIFRKQNLKNLLLVWFAKKSKEQIIKEYIPELQNQFPDVQDSVVAVYPSGEKNVIVEFVSKVLFQINQNLNSDLQLFSPIENGKITKDYTYFDNSK